MCHVGACGRTPPLLIYNVGMTRLHQILPTLYLGHFVTIAKLQPNECVEVIVYWLSRCKVQYHTRDLELLFVFQSVWGDKSGYYYVFGFAAVVGAVLVVSVVETVIIGVYFQLCAEVSQSIP